MHQGFKLLFLFLLGLLLSNCSRRFSSHKGVSSQPNESRREIISTTEHSLATLSVGAERLELYLPLVAGKSIGIVSNHTGRVGTNGTLLPDTLLALKQNVVRLFSPEHGFRGTSDAGRKVKDMIDSPTGLSIISLYGDKKKPNKEDLRGIDVLLFDLQDVGTRFYTYISTLHYVMEAAAEHNIPLIVLDRPNPNDFIDGPLLTSSCRSFVGMHPIPLLHGLTIGELALMINEEQWLSPRGLKCHLTIIPIKGWKHGDPYSLPINPSPNLNSDDALRLYPSLCLFEATIMSVGRGTDMPFTCIGYPDERMGNYTFIPRSKVGASNPKYNGKKCYGEEFASHPTIVGFNLSPLLKYHKKAKEMGYTLIDRSRMFDLLAGSPDLRKQIEAEWSEDTIRASWKKNLEQYKKLHARYLIYSGKYSNTTHSQYYTSSQADNVHQP